MKTLLYIGTNNANWNRVQQTIQADYLFIGKNSAIQAFEFLNQTTTLPDLIIWDENLPGMKAIQFCELIRKNKNWSKLIFLILSDQPSSANRMQYLEAGIDDVISSQFVMDNYKTRLDFLSDYRKSNQANTIKKDNVGIKIGFAKRMFDIALAGTALILLSPILMVVSVAIRMESKGPIFYAAKRVGAGYKIFDFYKFRSMKIDADQKLVEIKNLNQYAAPIDSKLIDQSCDQCAQLGKACSPMLFVDGKEICEQHHMTLKKLDKAGTFIKIKDDPRVTRIGKFIRNTSIDELPQLINVLKGEMSIVGNRPLPLYEAEQLTSDFWALRFNAPAGLTGLWQVEKRGGGSMSEEERKTLDNTYAKNHSFLKDIWLIMRTVPALFQSENV